MYAPGLPSKKAKHPLPSIDKPKVLEFGLHEHLSEGAAGKHFDLRIGDPETGHAHSWAMKYWPKPGEVRLAVQQPTHTVEYMDFKGRIPSGYGAGQVNLARREKVEVLSSDPSHVRFNLYPGQHVEEYLLRKTDKDWLLHNVTTRRDAGPGMLLPASKPHYKAKEPGKLKLDDPNTILQAKVDGAHVTYQFKDPGSTAKVFSYRPAERATGLIDHTPRLPEFYRTPKELKNTILRGELYAVDSEGKALPSQIIGGLLNSGVWKSREKQEQLGKLVPMVFDVVKWHGKDVEHLPYAEKAELLRKAVGSAPWLRLPRTAETAEEKYRLFGDIASGKEPSTVEGVIEWHKDKPLPVKAKFREDQDVYVRDIYKEQGHLNRPFAAGFTYSRTPTGPIVGHVSSGLSHELKKNMNETPEKFRGLAAIIKTTRGHVGRAPAFVSFHLDQELPEKTTV